MEFWRLKEKRKIMKNYDKYLLRQMIIDGKTDREILRYIECKPSTIKKYRKALKMVIKSNDNY